MAPVNGRRVTPIPEPVLRACVSSSGGEHSRSLLSDDSCGRNRFLPSLPLASRMPRHSLQKLVFLCLQDCKVFRWLTLLQINNGKPGRWNWMFLIGGNRRFFIKIFTITEIVYKCNRQCPR
ncbi:hypothetical protein AVEN_181143-1 [Araneus ventricosus]|uniref:Uncharacterized protein n=1 Tax=Araneus ventricosus TaxID=182803 RepID=A0A4Y2KQ07_ARAVE|nr:hypothetical protein AVEN_181143-1 [Araneus ventricosus]